MQQQSATNTKKYDSEQSGTKVSGGGISRRSLLAGGSAAAALGATGLLGVASPAGAASSSIRLPSLPNPIPGGPLLNPDDPNSIIHFFLPGPEGASTPIFQIPAEGLDAEPSLITDFKGWNAMAVVAGEVTTGTGDTELVEFDVRVMEGRYVDVDGVERESAFAFL